jgi:hypothetical protein
MLTENVVLHFTLNQDKPSCAGFFHLGFDNELVARFADGAFRGQLLKSVPDRLGTRPRSLPETLSAHPRR